MTELVDLVMRMWIYSVSRFKIIYPSSLKYCKKLVRMDLK